MKVGELIKILQKHDERLDIHWKSVLNKTNPDDDETYDFNHVRFSEETATCMYYNPDPDFDGVETTWLEICLVE